MDEDINHFVNVRQPQCLLNEGDLLFLLSKASIARIASPELGTAQPMLVFSFLMEERHCFMSISHVSPQGHAIHSVRITFNRFFAFKA